MSYTKRSSRTISTLAFVIVSFSVLAACVQSDSSTLRIYSVVQDANGNAVSDPSKADQFPKGLEFYSYKNGEGIFVELPAIIDETCLEEVFAATDPLGSKPVLKFELTDPCTKKFANFTQDNVGRQMAIVLNGELLTVPRINQPITGGAGFVDANFESMAAAEEVVEAFNIPD